MPGGYVCSASMKARLDGAPGSSKRMRGKRATRKLFTKPQRAFYDDARARGARARRPRRCSGRSSCSSSTRRRGLRPQARHRDVALSRRLADPRALDQVRPDGDVPGRGRGARLPDARRHRPVGRAADEDEDRAPAVLRSVGGTWLRAEFTGHSGRRALAWMTSPTPPPRRPPAPRIRVALADDSFLMREAVHQVVEHHDDVEIVADCGDGAPLLAEVRAHAARTSWSPTCACRPPATTRASASPRGCARPTPTIGVVVLSHYAEPRYGLEPVRRRRGGPRLSAQGPRVRRPPAAGRDRGRRARRLDDRPRDGAPAARERGARATTRRSTSSRRASARCSRRWRPARATPRSPRSSS